MSILAYVFLGCFIFGLVISLGSFLFGMDDADGSGHGADGDGGMPWLSLSSITVFLAWFGGTGYFLNSYAKIGPLLSLLAAVVVGFSGAFVIVWFLHKFLTLGNNQMRSADYYMPGTIGRITSSIRAGGAGEIMYVQGGTRKTAAAVSDEGIAHKLGDEVVIVKYEKGIAYIRAIEDSPTRENDSDSEDVKIIT